MSIIVMDPEFSHEGLKSEIREVLARFSRVAFSAVHRHRLLKTG